jgi:hypothetical protein
MVPQARAVTHRPVTRLFACAPYAKQPKRRMKFLCDEMGKRPGEWLRVAGYDVLMLPDGTRNDLYDPSTRWSCLDVDDEHPFRA